MLGYWQEITNQNKGPRPVTETINSISKFLSYVLRHKPAAIGLNLDQEGWANIEELIEKADIRFSRDMLLEVVATSEKKRFAISDNGQSIRANQGHSITVDLGLEPVEPPELLFHGTATRFLDSIQEQGLRPQDRKHVHLSADIETATKVGKRHGKPVILTIPAQKMHLQGHPFFKSENGVWLTGFVPAADVSKYSK